MTSPEPVFIALKLSGMVDFKKGIPDGLKRPSSSHYSMMVLPTSFQLVISNNVLLLFYSEGWLCLFFCIISKIIWVIFKESSAIAFTCKFCLLF